MSRRAMIEEASESDSDPSDFDPEDFDPSTIIRPSQAASTSRPTPHEELKPQFKAPSTSIADQEKYKTWQCLYPVYFDINRSRAEGRRVGKELAVENPLARELADAVQFIGFNVVFEPAKMHPKDWANPGRVKLQFKDGGKVQHTHVTNKHHLYTLVAKYLQAHPTTQDSPRRVRIVGLPLPDRPLDPPAVPRGWKMGTILPLHSPAVSGGGVSENIFKDMMNEMQGGSGPATVAQIEGTGPAAESKKAKKKVKA